MACVAALVIAQPDRRDADGVCRGVSRTGDVIVAGPGRRTNGFHFYLASVRARVDRTRYGDGNRCDCYQSGFDAGRAGVAATGGVREMGAPFFVGRVFPRRITYSNVTP